MNNELELYIHNCGYWSRKNYLGLGLGSSSMVDNVRWKNTDGLETYIKLMNEGKPLDALRCEVENVSYKEQMEEYMFLGLRMMKGIVKEEFFELMADIIRKAEKDYGLEP